jgi:hypothetical protein
MNYLMTPLEEHYDDGFGAMAMSFRLAAEKLKKIEEDDSFLQHLPLNFLLRHSIELYLKSGIIILHRRFRIPFGDKPSTSEPMVFDGTHWKPFHKVHSIGKLFGHWEGLIAPNAEKIQSVCEHKPDWTVPKPLYEWIDAIEKTDRTSTYYRYPKTSEEKDDSLKSSYQEISLADLFDPNRYKPEKPTVTFALKNDDGDFTRAFTLDRSAERMETEALENAAKMLDNFEAMMRFELTDGW